MIPPLTDSDPEWHTDMSKAPHGRKLIALNPGQIPLYTAPPSKQEPAEYDAPALYKAKAGREQKTLCWLKETGSIGGGYEQTTWGDTSGFPVFTAPPSKPWVSLTGDEIDDIASESGFGYINVARTIEAALRSKNEG